MSAESPSEILDAVLAEEFEACRASEGAARDDSAYDTLQHFWLHLDERFSHIVRSLYLHLSAAKCGAFVEEMEARLDTTQFDSVLVTYLAAYRELLPGEVRPRTPKEVPMRWYVQGKGTAREPLVVLVPDLPLRGQMTEAGEWKALDSSSASASAHRVPAPCIFDGLFRGRAKVCAAWEEGKYSSTRERWSLDSVKVPALLGTASRLSHVVITTYPFRKKAEPHPFGDSAISILRLTLRSDPPETLHVLIHFSLRLRDILEAILARQTRSSRFEPQKRTKTGQSRRRP